ncbi:MAG TPA: flavin reductase family protein [Phycisphaerales bacterium]|nr:flavin reductase family protein [Phycisphaerales bacterium]
MESRAEKLIVAERYKLLIGCIVPRPIAFVSTLSPDGKCPNLAPFSFFNGVGSDPMMILFCVSNKPDGSEKDTLRNCKPASEGGQGQFVVNASVEPYVRKVAAAAEDSAYGVSEFELVGLATEPSVVVAPPRVKDAPWCFECETMQILRTNPGRPGGGNVVLGRVIHVKVDDALLNERMHVNPDKLRAVGRMGGITYARTRERFELPMGLDALTKELPFKD